MVFSKTTTYGIRALVYLAGHSTPHLCGLQEIAEVEKIPPAYLGKILGDLRKHHLLRSVKGIHGGYELAQPPESITIWNICEILDPISENGRCILRLEHCTPENICALDQVWMPQRKKFIKLLKTRTIAQIAVSMENDGLHPKKDAA